MKIRLLRVLIAIGVGIVISTMSIYVAYRNAQTAPVAWREQSYTQFQLKEIDRAILQYQQTSNAIPQSLTQLQSIGSFVQFEDNGEVLDGWRRPFLYSANGTNYLVTSYGRDGKPGGKNLDCALTDKNSNPIESQHTFNEFLDNIRCRGMIVSSIVCGALATFLSFLTVRIPNLSKRGITILVLSLCVTLAGTFIVTTIITALHIPSGH